MLYPYIDRHPRSWTISRDDPGSDLKVTHNHSLWDALAAALGVDSVTVLTTDEDIRPAEREQWDSEGGRGRGGPRCMTCPIERDPA